jgi:D-aminoacyl-tRNA deacylase
MGRPSGAVRGGRSTGAGDAMGPLYLAGRIARMRVVAQRVSRAEVRVGGGRVSAIGPGLCLFVGVAAGDRAEDAQVMARKVAGLRVFRDDEGKMNRSVVEAGGEALVISQFTLLADARRGRRPSFIDAAAPEVAEPLIEEMIQGLRDRGVTTAQGIFGEAMEVSLVNDGPVTLVLEVRQGSMT